MLTVSDRLGCPTLICLIVLSSQLMSTVPLCKVSLLAHITCKVDERLW